VESGLYYEQVKRYLEVFGEENCLIFLYEDLRKDIKAVYKKVCEYIEVDSGFIPDFKPQNESYFVKSAFISHYFRFYFPEFKRKRFVPNALVDKVTVVVNSINKTEKRPGKINPNTYFQLQKRFKMDLQKTESLIKRDLAHWYN
jgi:hypothetical protein